MNPRDLARALDDRRVADWVLTTREQDVATVDELVPVQRRESRSRWTLVVHDDVSNGRGSARVELSGHDGNAGELADQALALAHAAIGTAWRSLPQAAPAHVDLRDPALDVDDLPGATTAILRALPRPPGTRVSASATAMRETVTVQTKQGLHTTWTATHARGSVFVARGEHSLRVAREARSASQLEVALRGALDSAIVDLDARATADAPVAGPCVLVVRDEALLHGGGYGMWSVFATQADAVLERQGLTRYREGMPVAPGADQVDHPLAIKSDGAYDHGVHSAPVGDDGDAIRAFSLVERGLAAGLSLSPREAALRHRDPNGGVRDLVIAGGRGGAPPDSKLPTIEIARLRSLAIDPYTGEASMEIALGFSASRRAFAGGTIRVDLVAALARAVRSDRIIHRGPYHGPAQVWIDDVEIVA